MLGALACAYPDFDVDEMCSAVNYYFFKKKGKEFPERGLLPPRCRGRGAAALTRLQSDRPCMRQGRKSKTKRGEIAAVRWV